MDNYYEVIPVCESINCTVEVPGSKSITNRALLLASMARGKSVLTNVLFSDDSRGFMECLDVLGYDITIDEAEKRVELVGGMPALCKLEEYDKESALKSCQTQVGFNSKAQKDRARINVRSAGTSARFITAMLAARSGEYIIDASEQMKSRPMKPLMDALGNLGCKIEYLEKDGFLPFKISGGNLSGGEIDLEAERSSQFLSALLMTGCLHKNDLKIRPAGKEISKSYVDITLKMMGQFGVHASRKDGVYTIASGQEYMPREYKIEPDVSSACYFYAAAALTGGQVIVKDVFYSSMQGDIKFLDILEKLGCMVSETDEGIRLTGPDQGKFDGIDVDMNDCSDQTMTLAALAPFAQSPTVIRNIGHIKHQESNRVRAILSELSRMGIKCTEVGDGIMIYPGTPKAAVIETYDDHRMAMAFSLVGLRTQGIKIANPLCTSKTFENYFNILDDITSN